MLANYTGCGLKLEKAVKWLREQKKPSMHEVIGDLLELKAQTSVVAILNELNPQRLGTVKIGESTLLDNCLAEINERAPVDEMQMYSYWEGGDGTIPFLIPESVGYPMGWDEWAEMLGDLSPEENQESLQLFVFANVWRLEPGETMEEVAQILGWDNLDMSKGAEVETLDWKRFEAGLRRKWLGVFMNGLNACWYQTGNIYFDYNPYDDDQGIDLPNFNLEGVHWLEGEWQAAQPILEDLRVASELFAKDKRLAGTIMRIAGKCAVQRTRVRIGGPDHPLTLVEVFEEEGRRQHIIDPFYGPLDCDMNDLDEEENDGDDDESDLSG